MKRCKATPPVSVSLLARKNAETYASALKHAGMRARVYHAGLEDDVRELSLPIIVHDRDAHERVMTLVKEEKVADVGGVFHCFSGDLEMANACIALGFYISIPGTITYKNAEQFRETVRYLPLESLLVETDDYLCLNCHTASQLR